MTYYAMHVMYVDGMTPDIQQYIRWLFGNSYLIDTFVLL